MHLLVPQYQHGVIDPHAAVHVAAGFLVIAMGQEGARCGVQVGHAGQQTVAQINTGMVRICSGLHSGFDGSCGCEND